MTTLKVGLVQQSCSADHAGNIDKNKAAIRLAAAKGAELVVLQELHNSLYFCQTENTEAFDQAETTPEITMRSAITGFHRPGPLAGSGPLYASFIPAISEFRTRASVMTS